MRLLVEIYNKIVEDKVETDFYECEVIDLH